MQVLHPGGTTARDASTLSPAHLGYVPALDGLRAVAVGAVLLFHAGFAVADGGFLGVSMFFTLSGFLITSVVLAEWTRSGAIGLRTFWSRRFRRLLAASWLTMGVVVAMGAAGVWNDDQLRSLRGDVPWSLAELANWHFIAKGTSYGASQTAPSPLEHFWSLAIEQQFYVLLPLLLVGMLVLGGGSSRVRLRRTMWVLAGLGAASAAANGILARSSIDRAYFGTDTRAAELIAGVLLAGLLLGNLRFDGADRRIAVAAGAAGSVTLVVMFHSAELTSPWLYPWGLLLTAACTASIIVASLQRGPIASVLSMRPVVAVGRISYGLYLLHWPIFLWLTPERTGLDQPGVQAVVLFGLRMAVTSVAALAMFRWVEQPVRSRRLLTGTEVRFVVPLAAVLLLVGDAGVTSGAAEVAAYLKPRTPGAVAIREAPQDTTSAEETTTPTATEPAATEPAATEPVGEQPTTVASSTVAPSPDAAVGPAPTAAPATTPIAPRHPRRVLLVGDSVAASIEGGLGDALHARGITFATAAAPGCGVITGDPADANGNPLSFTTACNAAIPGNQAGAVAAARPDLVVVLSTWETGDRIVDGRWYRIGTPEAEQMLHRLYGATIGRLSKKGARVLLLNVADVVDGQDMAADPEVNRRAALLNPIIATIGATAPGVDSFDFASMICPTTPCPTQVDGITLRAKDGRHFDGADAQRWVGGRLADRIAEIDLDRM